MTKGTLARTICLGLALGNMILKSTGHEVLPISDEQINNLVSELWVIGSAVWAWWKNNSITQEAIEADNIMKAKKNMKKVR